MAQGPSSLLALACFAFALATTLSAQAYAPPACPRPNNPRYCAKYELRLATQRAELEKAARLVAYRAEHPWKLRLDLVPSFTLLGMNPAGNMYGFAAGMWGGAIGVAVHRDYRLLSIMVEASARAGAGGIGAKNLAYSTRVLRPTGLIEGAELHGELRFHRYSFFGGPAASVGVLHFTDARDVSEDDTQASAASAPDADLVKVPSSAGFAAVGGVIGREHDSGKGELGGRFMAGTWDGLDHVYVQLAAFVAVSLWD